MLSFVKTTDNNVIIMLPFRFKRLYCGAVGTSLVRGEINKKNIFLTWHYQLRTTGENSRDGPAPFTTHAVYRRLTVEKKVNQRRMFF